MRSYKFILLLHSTLALILASSIFASAQGRLKNTDCVQCGALTAKEFVVNQPELALKTCIGNRCNFYSGPNPLTSDLSGIAQRALAGSNVAEREHRAEACLLGSTSQGDANCQKVLAVARTNYVERFNGTTSNFHRALVASQNGKQLVLHHSEANLGRFEHLLANQDFMAKIHLYGFSQVVYTNDRDKTFSSDLLRHELR